VVGGWFVAHCRILSIALYRIESFGRKLRVKLLLFSAVSVRLNRVVSNQLQLSTCNIIVLKVDICSQTSPLWPQILIVMSRYCCVHDRNPKRYINEYVHENTKSIASTANSTTAPHMTKIKIGLPALCIPCQFSWHIASRRIRRRCTDDVSRSWRRLEFILRPWHIRRRLRS
jgi:hypothetical protein